MSQKALIQLASRALSLNLVVTSVVVLFQISIYLPYLFHFWSIPSRTAGEDFYLNAYATAAATHLVMAAALFVASVWLYKSGPDVHKFLAPTEE